MFTKLLLVAAFIGYAAAACNMKSFQSKCMKYAQPMQEAGEAAQPDIPKICCITNEMVSCTEEQGCAEEMKQQVTPAKGQLARMCGSYNYVKGCSDGAAATDAPASAMSALPSLALITITTLLLRC